RPGSSEGRLSGKLGGNRIVNRGVVVDAIARAKLERFIWNGLPGHRDARREVMFVGLQKTGRHAGRSGNYYGGRSEARRNVQIRNVTIFFAQRTEIFPSQTEIQRQ